MVDCFTKAQRSHNMSRIRSNGNWTTEQRFMGIMRRFKIRGWRRGSKLPGKPDFVFHSSRVAVFIDGDFWHGHPKKGRLPKSNLDYWKAKIDRNRARDKEVNRALKKLNWRVLRIWESALRDEEAVAAKVAFAIVQ
jgi:DNA mismatch endonuclease (patch repair protein)